MKKKFIMLPLLALLLGACAPETNSTSESQQNGSSTTETSGQTSETTPSGSTSSVDQTVKVTAINITPAVKEIYRGESFDFTASVTPSNATTKLTWTIEGGEGVIVDQKGHVSVSNTASLQEGTYQVKASADGVSATANIKVLDFDRGTKEEPLTIKETIALFEDHYTANMYKEIFVKGKISEASKLENVTGVKDHKGKIQDGEDLLNFYKLDVKENEHLVGRDVVIKGSLTSYEVDGATLPQIEKGEIVTISPLPKAEDFTLTESSKTLKQNETYQISATFTPEATEGTLTYTFEDERITVSETGLITVSDTATSGTVTITVGLQGTTVTKSFTLTIDAPEYGTLQDPLTTSEALALIGSDYVLKENIYVAGVISEINALSKGGYQGYITNSDNAEEFRFYGLTSEETKENLLNKNVILCGKPQIDSSKPRIFEPTIVKTLEAPAATGVKKVGTDAKIDVEQGQTTQLEVGFSPIGSTGAVEWSTTAANITVVDGLVTVGKEAALGDAVIKATLTGTEKFVEYTINVTKFVNYGTKDAPLTTKEADTLITQFNHKVEKDIFVKGVVTNIYKTKKDGFIGGTITDAAGTLNFFKLDLGKYTTDELKGREVIIAGHGTQFNNKNQIEPTRIVELIPFAQAEDFTLTPETATVTAGKTTQLTVTLPDKTEGTVTFESNNEKVTVSKDGLVSVAVDATGTAIITASMNTGATTVKKTCTITIENAPKGYEKVTLDTTSLNGHKNDETFSENIAGAHIASKENTGTTPMRWQSDHVRVYVNNKIIITPLAGKAIESVTFVTSNGYFTDKNNVKNADYSYEGNAYTITPIDGAKPIEINVTVNKREITSITVESHDLPAAQDFTLATEAEVIVGTSLQLEAQLPPSTVGTFTWTVDKADKASIVDGLLTLNETAVVGDTLVVTATLVGTDVSKTCNVTVIEQPKAITATLDCTCLTGKNIATGITFGGEGGADVTITSNYADIKDDHLYVLKDDKITIKVPEGMHITKIVFKGSYKVDEDKHSSFTNDYLDIENTGPNTDYVMTGTPNLSSTQENLNSITTIHGGKAFFCTSIEVTYQANN